MKVKVVANINGDKNAPLVVNVLSLDDACSIVDYFSITGDPFDVQIFVSHEGG